MIKLTELLEQRADLLLDHALAELRQARLEHYEAEGMEAARLRLSTLLELTLSCLRERRAEPIVAHAERVARERFEGGYGLGEVQVAFNLLEEALWQRILAGVAPDEIAGALGLVSAILGQAKDALARAYVELATQSK